MRFSKAVLLFALTSMLGACGHRDASQSAASPAPDAGSPVAAAVTTAPATEANAAATAPASASTAVATGAVPAELSPGPSAVVSPVAAPTPTENPNLLDAGNGTILRSYSPVALDNMNDGSLDNAANGIGSELAKDAVPPFVFTFELPGVATISGFTANMRAPENDKSPPNTLTIAVSTTSATDGFHDVGTMSQGAGATDQSLKGGVTARWVRVTANALFNNVKALGTMAPLPKPAAAPGVYVEQQYPQLGGVFVPQGAKPDRSRVRIVTVGTDVVATECTDREADATYVGTMNGREWFADDTGTASNPSPIRASFDDEGQTIAGASDYGNGSRLFFSRTNDTPKFCAPQVHGVGTHKVLVLDQNRPDEFYPTDADPPFPNYQFTSILAGEFDASALAAQPETVAVRDICHVTQNMGPAQRKLLLDYIAAGHKLIVASAGCNDGADYSWLPYPFVMNGSGPESDNSSLLQLEQSALGTDDKADAAHFADVKAYLSNSNNKASSALPVSTGDEHWCGHFFVAKTTNLNGFITMYAPYGKGMILYDGFSNRDSEITQAHRFRELEMTLPVDAALPCTQHVSDHFFLSPNGELTFAAGKASTLHATMELYANLAYAGHVTLTATGPIPATVSPSAFDIAGGVQSLDIAVNVPASAKPGAYTIAVNGDLGNGRSATATLLVTGTGAPIRKASIALHQHIRIYGIHFDYDSATIQSRSEPVMDDIASLMKANPSWHFEVSGHTDSDGGAAYNLGLSQRRAQSVVADLTKKHGIAASRLVGKGYGLTRPVATNATPAGKALNRRVELERLQ